MRATSERRSSGVNEDGSSNVVLDFLGKGSTIFVFWRPMRSALHRDQQRLPANLSKKSVK